MLDFDGTLSDSAEWVMGALNDAAPRFGFSPIRPDEAEALRGMGDRAVIRRLGVPFWRLPAMARHMRARMAAEADAVRLFPGAEDLLHGLFEAGATLAIVSSNAEATVRRILGPELAALVACFECGASLSGKARRFRRVLRRTGIAADAAIGLGDEARDIDAARAAGVDAAAVAWGYATAEFLALRRPGILFPAMEDVLPALMGQPASAARDRLVLQA